MDMGDSPAQFLLDQPTIIAALSPEDIRDAAARLLDSGNLVHLTLLPEN
jgi:predicted Zn-dependent peptidase